MAVDVWFLKKTVLHVDFTVNFLRQILCQHLSKILIECSKVNEIVQESGDSQEVLLRQLVGKVLKSSIIGDSEQLIEQLWLPTNGLDDSLDPQVPFRLSQTYKAPNVVNIFIRSCWILSFRNDVVQDIEILYFFQLFVAYYLIQQAILSIVLYSKID